MLKAKTANVWDECSAEHKIANPHPIGMLERDVTVDVAIVGGGYTGLWPKWWLGVCDFSGESAKGCGSFVTRCSEAKATGNE